MAAAAAKGWDWTWTWTSASMLNSCPRPVPASRSGDGDGGICAKNPNPQRRTSTIEFMFTYVNSSNRIVVRPFVLEQFKEEQKPENLRWEKRTGRYQWKNDGSSTEIWNEFYKRRYLEVAIGCSPSTCYTSRTRPAGWMVGLPVELLNRGV